MPITDPQAIRFINEVARPISERVRDLHALMTDAKARWLAEVAALVPNDVSTVDDGRDAEGVSRLTGADVNAAIAVLGTLIADLDAAGKMDAIRLLTVRSLTVV